MEELKLGDIRKFDNGVIGVVCNTSNGPYYEVIEPNGEKRMIPDTMSYSIPKLKPELRSLLNTLSEAIVDCESKRKAVSEAYMASSRANDRVNELIERLKTFGQEMGIKEFEKAVIKYLGPKYKIICDKGYILNFKFGVESLSLTIQYRKIVRKYANTDNTPYVFQNYDGSLSLERYKESYSKEVEKLSHLCLPFVFNKINGLMSYDTKELNMADKNTIIFSHDVHYCFLGAKLTEEMAAKVAKSIQIQK